MKVLPAVEAGVDLGDEMLDHGPGPGAAPAWLCRRVGRLVVVERDELWAAALRFHHEDTCSSIEPATLLGVMGAHGSVGITIQVDDGSHCAHEPSLDPSHPRTEE